LLAAAIRKLLRLSISFCAAARPPTPTRRQVPLLLAAALDLPGVVPVRSVAPDGEKTLLVDRIADGATQKLRVASACRSRRLQ
jgi:hypothetical protein